MCICKAVTTPPVATALHYRFDRGYVTLLFIVWSYNVLWGNLVLGVVMVNFNMNSKADSHQFQQQTGSARYNMLYNTGTYDTT